MQRRLGVKNIPLFSAPRLLGLETFEVPRPARIFF
jgi:hypothetical protein